MSIVKYAYQGDYEDLIDWILDAYDPARYDTFAEWLGDVKGDFRQSGHHFSSDIKDEMRGVWQQNFPDKPIRKPKLPEEDAPARIKTYNTLSSEGEFSTKDAYQANPDRPQSSIRRELQQLTKEGLIERISIGVYRVV